MRPTPASTRSKDRLRTASVAYLALPYLLFAAAWLSLPFALLMIAAVVTGAVFVSRTEPPQARTTHVTATGWILTLVIAALWISVSGIGGHGVQNLLDYAKHDAILSDLITKDWPVRYDAAGPNGSVPLVYYTGFYLPAALVGKVAGWRAANEALFLWALTGVFLALQWFRRAAARGAVIVPVVFVLAGGLDVIGYWTVYGHFPTLLEHLEHWASPFQYSSNTTLLYWVPQHAIAAWIAAGLLLEEFRTREKRNIWFMTALSALWSPMVTIGLLPFAALATLKGRMKDAKSWQNLAAAPVILAIMAAYYRSSIARIGGTWLFAPTVPVGTLAMLPYFYVFEFGLYAFALRLSPPTFDDNDDKATWRVALFVLLALPVYFFGTNDDLLMRASIPALFVFWSFAARAVADGLRRPEGRAKAAALLFLLSVSAVTAMHEIGWGIFGGPDDPAAIVRWRGADRQDSSATPTHTIPALHEQQFIAQYLGTNDSFFFRALAKKERRQ